MVNAGVWLWRWPVYWLLVTNYSCMTGTPEPDIGILNIAGLVMMQFISAGPADVRIAGT